MATLRCTAKYRKIAGLPSKLEEPPEHTVGALGDWYADTLNVGHDRYLLYMSETSRLSVIVTLKTRHTAEPRFQRALRQLLGDLGVEDRLIDREMSTFEPFFFAKTRSRSVLGSMNDQSFLAQHILRPGDVSLWETVMSLSKTPCSPLGMESPGRVAPRLLRERWGLRLVKTES